jgi:hypothetical protein
MNMKKIGLTISVSTAALLLFAACGGDRSTLYDDTGKKISSGKSNWIYDTTEGQIMQRNNFVYIPGGFDVDGDGENEKGFWLAKYEARETNETVQTVGLGTVSALIRNNFLIYDSATKRFDKQLASDDATYTDRDLSSILGFSAKRVRFTDEGNATGSYSAIEAVVALEASQIAGSKWHISLPSEKQWMQVVKLVINNPENWSSGKVGEGKLFRGVRYGSADKRYFVISNGLLGTDPNVPKAYSVRVHDLSGNLAEWTTGMLAIDDRFLGGDGGEQEYTALGATVPKWWLPILEGKSTPLPSLYGVGKYYDGSTISGANDTLNITGSTGFVDNYAVVSRGGSMARGDKALTGISAAKLEYGPGYKDPSIGFRAASAYVE